MTLYHEFMATKNPVAARRVTEFQEKLAISSDRKLARLVFNRWDDAEPDLPIKDAAGLAVKVGQLKKGVLTWWLKYPGAVRALAAVLERDVIELEIREDDEAEAHIFRFDDLPDLRPIDLRSDSPFVLGLPNWFSNEWFGQLVPVWIEAPPGAGKSLAARWHAAQGTASVLRVARLIDAVERLPDSPVVIDVEGAHPESDREALRTLRSRKQLLVLAPFSPPTDDDDSTPKIKKRSLFPRAALAPLQSGFSCHRWQPEKSWRATFLKWIADRQKLSDAWTDRVLNWIDHLGPMGKLFDTPGALLPVLRIAGTESQKRFDAADFVKDWLSLTIAKSATDRSPCSLWLQAHGRELAEALIEARLDDATLPWKGGLSRAEWAALVPRRLAARLAGEDVRQKLKELVDVHPRRRAKEIEKTARLLEEPSPEEAIQYLVASRLLRSVGTDKLDIHPRWVAELHAGACAFRVVKREPPATWGRWAVDEARRPHVDAALDLLGADQFKQVAMRALRDGNAVTLGNAGAIEALFWAVARCLRLRASPLDASALEKLWHLQSPLIQRREGWAPEPLTRPGIQGRLGSGPEWIACCWTWSLRVKRPNKPLLPGDAWLFPGWIRPPLAKAPKWFEWMHQGADLTPEEVDRWNWLVSMVRSLVEHCDDAVLPVSVPEVLFPEILRASARKGWKVTDEVAKYLFYNGRTPALALQAVATLPESEQVTIARGLWQALVVEKSGNQPLWNLVQKPEVFDFVVQHTTEDDIRQAVRLKKVTFPFLNPSKEGTDHQLPIPLWEAALHELLVLGPAQPSLPPDMDQWPRWTGPIVEALIGKQQNMPEWLGIQNLWAVDPDRALLRTAAAFPDAPTAMYWVSEGWSRRRDAILDLIEQHARSALPVWVLPWLARNLGDTPGGAADRIFALMARIA